MSDKDNKMTNTHTGYTLGDLVSYEGSEPYIFISYSHVDTDEVYSFLKYVEKERVIKGLKKISKPGLRVYAKANELPKVLNGLGIAIISTSNGIMTDREARKQKLGGEVIAFVW